MQGPRTIDDFVNFAQRVTANPIHTIASAGEFAGIKGKADAKFYLLVVCAREGGELGVWGCGVWGERCGVNGVVSGVV